MFRPPSVPSRVYAGATARIRVGRPVAPRDFAPGGQPAESSAEPPHHERGRVRAFLAGSQERHGSSYLRRTPRPPGASRAPGQRGPGGHHVLPAALGRREECAVAGLGRDVDDPGLQVEPVHGVAGDGTRTAQAPEAERAIAALATTRVAQGGTALLDAGSTVAALARALHGARDDLAVVTPSLSAVLELAGAEGVHVTCLGGHYRPLSHAFVGPLTRGRPGAHDVRCGVPRNRRCLAVARHPGGRR
ncbi:hypothetical protein AB0D13_23935 [Streptomyces sp. NPDC048430]|uniref:hypothetical protein n=1 Tax=Streptomyces sp. NPDC048430 TaxID=3155388 RepID=UPI003440097A